MVYAEPYVYLRALGTFGSTATEELEQWGVGLKFRNPGAAPSAANLSAFAESAAAPFSAFHSAAGTGAGVPCWLKTITAAYIGTDGKYVGGAGQQTTVHTLATPTQGQGSIGAPFTQALVYSLRTPLTRGPGSNGRMYYPCLGNATASSTGVMSTSTVAGAVAAARTLFNALNTAADANLPGTGGLSVMSNVSTGVAATVTGVRVSNHLDRQERREKQLPEAYQLLSVTPIAGFVARDRNRPIGT